MTAIEQTSAARTLARAWGVQLGWRRWALLPGLALWVALLRLPTLDLAFADFDEGFFLLVGDAWNQGHLPYEAIWDVKPPGLFALFALGQRLIGPGLLASRLLADVAVLASSLCLHRFARRHLARPLDGGLRSDRLPLAAALLYPAYSMAMYGTYTRAELLLAPLVISGFDLVLSCRRTGGRPLPLAAGAGLLFGAAFMVKQTAICELIFAGLLVLAAGIRRSSPPTGRRDLTPALTFATAAALPTLAFLGYFAAHGVAPRLFLAPFVAASHRLGGDGLTFGEGLLRFLPMSVPSLPLMIGTAVLLLAERGGAGRLCRERSSVWLVCGWLVSALAAVLAMRAMYPYYFQPLVPPLLLLGLLGLRAADDQLRAAMATSSGGFSAKAAAVPLLILLIGLYPYGWLHWSNREESWPNHLPFRAAERLAANGLTPASTLYVPNADPVLYLLAGIQPPTRYAYPQHLVCAFPLSEGTQAGEVGRILALRPDFIALARTQKSLCQRDDALRPVEVVLATDYRLLETVEAERQSIVLYRKKGE